MKELCFHCKGSGVDYQPTEGGTIPIEKPCPFCGGTGEIEYRAIWNGDKYVGEAPHYEKNGRGKTKAGVSMGGGENHNGTPESLETQGVPTDVLGMGEKQPV